MEHVIKASIGGHGRPRLDCTCGWTWTLASSWESHWPDSNPRDLAHKVGMMHYGEALAQALLHV